MSGCLASNAVDTTATIIAIASPPGRSPRGIIRLSGNDVLALLRVLLASAPESGAGGEAIPCSRGIYKTRIKLNTHTIPALLLNYPAPNSYTSEHSAEFLLPGNPALLQRIIDYIIEQGSAHNLDIRTAEPGEFTARAFFNDRLTLTQAEGVAATIAAQSDAQLRAAAFLRNDSVGQLAATLCADLARALALLEAGIDFTDEQDVVAITTVDLLAQLRSLRERITNQLDRAIGFGQYDATPRIVLTGPPNAGKSTLFNVLLGRTRAVVSDVAGTTRDVLIEPLHIPTTCGDLEVLLIDIAGIENAESSLMHQHMQNVAADARARADLLLRCVPLNEVLTQPLAPNEVLVRTKSDLNTGNCNDENAVCLSAATQAGLDDLRRIIIDRLADRAVSLAADAVALLPRHEAALRAADEALADALQLLEHSDERIIADAELVAAAMRAALDQLGLVAGRVTPDDILGHIFSEFCIGK